MINSSLSSSFIKELSNNFNGIPIYSISISCENPLTLGYWGGISNGCDCRNINSTEKIKITHENQLFIGDCSNNEKKLGCKNIKSISKKNIISYRTIQFCINKKNINYKTFLENSVSKNETCKNGYKLCGYLDSLEQKLCILEKEDCPINDIIINSSTESLTNYSTIQLTENKYIHFASGIIEKQIITSIKLSENVAPCIYPGEFSWKYHYPLELSSGYCNTTILSSKNDLTFIKVDNIKKSNLYEENNISLLLNTLPNYPFNKINDDKIDLFKRTYLGFDKKCMIEKGLSLDYFEYVKNNHQIANFCIKIIFYLVVIGGFFVIFLIIFINKIINKDFLQNIQYLKKYNSNIIIGTIGIFKIFLFILNIISLGKLNSIEIQFMCGDKFVNELITEMSRHISCNVDILIGMIICSSILIFSFFLLEFNNWKKIYDNQFENIENKQFFIKKDKNKEINNSIIN